VSAEPLLDQALPPVQPSEGPEFVQLLTPEGERVEHPDYPLEISDDEIKSLYRDLVLVRRIDTEAMALQRQGELGLWASLLGQEAAQVGAGRSLTTKDFAFPTYREHGVAFCKGVDPVTLLGLFRGTSQGGWDPYDKGFQLYTIVIGSQTLHATGYAMGLQRDGSDGAAMAFFGDGASSQGDVNEAFVWASSFNAPVVFFCQNNQWAISTPVAVQTAAPSMAAKAVAYGFGGVRCDGNDVLAVYGCVKDAVERARRGGGPTLVEALTYRVSAHSSSDDPSRYRDETITERWRARDPLARYRTWLMAQGLLDAATDERMRAELDAEVRDAVAKEEKIGPPPLASLVEDVFAEVPAHLREQLAEIEPLPRQKLGGVHQ
jgi:2-oxoisovalerate dehydrogenase E1 component alpha subunit